METRWMYNLKKLSLYLGYNANKYLGINLPETQFLILLRDLSKFWFSILFLGLKKLSFKQYLPEIPIHDTDNRVLGLIKWENLSPHRIPSW